MKMDCDKILLATSISPVGIENQISVIQSWIDCGFQVISVNCTDEISKICDFFPNVEFIKAKRDARLTEKKPLIYIYDMLQILKNRNNKICGLINSDIYLRNIDKDMYSFIMQECEHNLLYAHRHDINCPSDDVGMKFYGIDLFLFSKELIDVYEDEGYTMGAPTWDSWMVFIPRHFGKQAKELLNPVAFHVKHSQAWSDSVSKETASSLVRKYLNMKNCTDDYLLSEQLYRVVLRNPSKAFYADESVLDEISKKKVLIVLDKEMGDKTKKSICLQLHQNVEICYDDAVHTLLTAYIDADYVFMPYNGIDYDDMFLTCLLISASNSSGAVSSLCVYSSTLRIKSEDMFNYSNNAIAIGCSIIKPTALSDFLQHGVLPILKCERINTPKIEFDDYFNLLLSEKGVNSFYLFGGGNMLRRILDCKHLSQYKVLGIIDSSPSIQGSEINGIKVHSKDILMRDEYFDVVVISSLAYEQEIFDELISIIPPEKIIRLSTLH